GSRRSAARFIFRRAEEDPCPLQWIILRLRRWSRSAPLQSHADQCRLDNQSLEIRVDAYDVMRCWRLDHIIEVRGSIKSGSVLVCESPAPISVPIPRPPTRSGPTLSTINYGPPARALSKVVSLQCLSPRTWLHL